MMLRLLLFFITLQTANSSCPSGFDIAIRGECRGLYATTANVPYPDSSSTAITKCKEINANPVIIHNDEQQAYWTDKKITVVFDDKDLPLGLVCNNVSKRWEWADGSVVDYKPPQGTNADLDNDCKTGCSWDIWANGVWNSDCDIRNTHSYTQFVYCTAQLEQPVPSADGCDSFEDDSEDGVCYQVGVGAENWQGAQLSCRQLGANLASIHNQQENSFIRRLAVSKGLVSGLYLGATISGKGKEYGWIDGSDWDYENFRPGFPMTGFGECLSMDTSTSAGLWMNVDCNAELPVACVRDQKPVVEPTCSPGPWAEGELITSPGYPFNASIPCDYFLIVEAGKKVEVLVSLEANSCCDFVTFYEGDVGGALLANLTGSVRDVVVKTKTSNIMRVDWQPNGAVNVRGLLMSFRGFLH